MSHHDHEVRDEVVAAGAVTNVAQYLKGLSFPARKEDVASCARRNGADESAIEEIERLPEGVPFQDPVEVFSALGDEVRGL